MLTAGVVQLSELISVAVKVPFQRCGLTGMFELKSRQFGVFNVKVGRKNKHVLFLKLYLSHIPYFQALVLVECCFYTWLTCFIQQFHWV